MSELLESVEQEYQGFQITDDSTAEWAVRKIKEAQGDTAKWQAHFAAQLASIKKANDATVEYMTGLLAHYFEAVPHKDSKTMSKYELPSATLVRKQQQPEYSRDDDILLDYLEKEGFTSLIKIKREPDWASLKKELTKSGDQAVSTITGEIVPGVTVIERPDKFDVQIKGE